ncbi:hypothetical protein [Polyangium sorediatum]|uniref:Uncharacterized protein n=1 Tax=Polyangium sorediatum TaxID=889274 RepID=A0ABT6NTJ9_9BACT|nr:hypothetical protein [Polyangium sorediatum]MDI1431643.1 hypothetical protein [Polyangium sorediatum]
MPTLVDLIKGESQRSDKDKIFGPDFQTPADWSKYLQDRFGDGSEPVSALLRSAVDRDGFQALYVACWIYQPLEKGSFMIELESLGQVRQGYDTLPDRWSSHLGERGKSAGAGFQFLKGYSELLVQIESVGSASSALFLKCEGHAAISVKHMLSFFTKKITGAGNTASKSLQAQGKDPESVVEPRAAENYSKAYEKLLKAVGLKPKDTMNTVPNVASAMWKYLAARESHTLTAYSTGGGPRDASAVANLRGVKLAECLDKLRGAATNDLGPKDKLRVAVLAAKNDLDTIQANLKTDPAGTQRVFAEVKVTPRQLDERLRDFRAALARG